MKFSAKQIAELIKGSIEGDAEVSVYKLAKIESGEPGSLTFLANPLYTGYIYTTHASIVIVGKEFRPENPLKCTLIRVADPYAAFARLLEIYNELKLNRVGISDNASISANARIGENCYIGDFVFVGENSVIGNNVKIFPNTYIGDNVKIGENCILHAGVKIYCDSVIGSNCIFHAGVVIGADGFGFAPQVGKEFKKIAQIGNVIVEDFVEIGSNTTIDRATLGSTIIRRGVKLDNLIQVGHNVEIGENTVIAAQSGIAGSTKIGRNCMFAGQVGIVGHLTIADDVKIGAQGGVNSSIHKQGAILVGSPAIDASIFKRAIVHFKNLQSLVDDVRKLKESVLKK